MGRTFDIVTTAAAPTCWGATYLLFTEGLPTDLPWTIGGLRTFGAGLVLFVVRPRPLVNGASVALLGILNVALFSALLFSSAARLPGGLASTLTSLQPVFVVVLVAGLRQELPAWPLVVASTLGAVGVLLSVGPPGVWPDPVGVVCALGAAASMASGTVLVHHLDRLPDPLTLATWQLLLGGAVLLALGGGMEPVSVERLWSHRTVLLVLVVVFTALPYWSWTRGIRRLGPSVAVYGLLSPLVATVLDALVLQRRPGFVTSLGLVLILVAALLVARFQHPGDPP